MQNPRRLVDLEPKFAPCSACGQQPIVETGESNGRAWYRAYCPRQKPELSGDGADDLILLMLLWAVNNRPEDRVLI